MSESCGNDTEAGLIQRIADRDREAMADLARLYQHRLYRFVRGILERPEDAEECVVDVLLAVWQGACRFEGRSRVSTWIFGIAHRKALGGLSNQKRGAFVELDDELPLSSPEPDPEAWEIQMEDAKMVREATRRLSPEHREVIGLAFGEGKSYGEIAEIMGCPVNTVKTRAHYAKEHLKRLLVGMRSKRP